MSSSHNNPDDTHNAWRITDPSHDTWFGLVGVKELPKFLDDWDKIPVDGELNNDWTYGRLGDQLIFKGTGLLKSHADGDYDVEQNKPFLPTLPTHFPKDMVQIAGGQRTSKAGTPFTVELRELFPVDSYSGFAKFSETKFAKQPGSSTGPTPHWMDREDPVSISYIFDRARKQ